MGFQYTIEISNCFVRLQWLQSYPMLSSKENTKYNTASGKKSELLMPAGNLQKLKVALLYGADAVYLGTPDMSLRTKSDFSLDDIKEGVKFAHSIDKRVYLTLNIFSHNKDIQKLPDFVSVIQDINPDGVIISDPGILKYVQEKCPNISIHISTQANVCSWLSAKFWQEQGADLVVLAREVTFEELKDIRDKCPDLKLETFIHGAMCMTYSGRCLLSNYMSERGSNQGNCANSCRWNYKVHMRLKDGTTQELELNDNNIELFDFLLEEGCRPGELMPILEDERGSYILNSKDLCLMPILNDYLSIGVDSLKIEGRNKSLYYVAVVARAYRMAIDDWYENPNNWDYKNYLPELHTVPNRGFSLAFHHGRLEAHSHNYYNTSSIGSNEFAGIVTDINTTSITVEIKNKLSSGDVLEFLIPDYMQSVLLRMYEFVNIDNKKILQEVHGGLGINIEIPLSLFHLEDTDWLFNNIKINTIVRKPKLLSNIQATRLEYDSTAEKIELSGKSSKFNKLKLDKLTKQLINVSADKEKDKKTSIEKDSCCGKGCNGCLIFWNSPKYEKARTLLATKGTGRLLTKPEASKSING